MFTVFFIYLVGMVSVYFFPMAFQRSLLRSMQHQPWHQTYMSWNPIRSLYLIVMHDPLHDVVYTIGGNLVLLFPLGCLLPLMSSAVARRRAWVFSVRTSLAIEALQLALDAVFGYAYRSPELDQVLLNVIGFWVAWWLVRWIAVSRNLPTYEWSHAERMS